MSTIHDARIRSRVRARREGAGLSQRTLADTVGVTRQAIIAIEQGRQVPSTVLGLRLARALGCTVESLFSLGPSEGLEARLAPQAAGAASSRVVLGEVSGAWVAHRLPADPTLQADGIVAAARPGGTATVQCLADIERLEQNVIVTGCAPVLGTLAQRVGARFSDARATWLATSSDRSLDQLQEGLVHVAGLHTSDPESTTANLAVVRDRFPGERMLLVNLTRWREGLVVPRGNPLGLHAAEDLLRSGLRFALREQGAGAHRLLMRILEGEGGGDVAIRGPAASGHAEVAQLVRAGAADVGVAIEGVAVAAGLDFVPLVDERFDLVVPASIAALAPVSRLLDTLDEPSFRAEMAQLPGYDSDLTGHVTTLEAA